MTFLKNSYLIQYGEYRIALENLLDNLAEHEITLDDQILDLAVCAFDNNISLHDKVVEALSWNNQFLQWTGSLSSGKKACLARFNTDAKAEISAS